MTRLLESIGPTQSVAKGLYLDLPMSLIPDGGLSDGQNVEPGLGTIRKAPGYIRYSENEVPGTGPVMALQEFVTSAGVRSIMAATRTRLSKYNIATNQFTDLTGGANLLTGATTDRISCVSLADLFLVNNGKDAIKKSNGSTWADLGGSPPKFLGMDVYEGHVFGWNVNPGIGPGHRVQWSGLNLPETWATVPGQEQGFYDLQEENTLPIIAGGKMGRQYYLYKEQLGGIYAVTYTGNANLPMLFELAFPRYGVFSVHGVAVYRNTHFILGHDEQIYMMRGGGPPEPIGDPVRKRLFSRINWNKRQAAWIAVVPLRRQIIFGIPEGSSDVATRGYIFSLETGGWGEREFPFMCGSHIRDPETRTIDDLGLTPIDSLEGTVDDLSSQAKDVYLAGGEQASPFVYKYGSGEHADTVAIDAWAVGKWMGSGDGRQMRVRGVEGDLTGTAQVEIGTANSYTGPMTFTSLGPISEATGNRADANTSGRLVAPKFRSQGTYDSWELAGYRMDAYPLGRR